MTRAPCPRCKNGRPELKDCSKNGWPKYYMRCRTCGYSTDLAPSAFGASLRWNRRKEKVGK